MVATRSDHRTDSRRARASRNPCPNRPDRATRSVAARQGPIGGHPRGRPGTIDEGDSFAEDLHADSLALIELVEAIEEELASAALGSESRTKTSKISRPCVMPSTTSSPGSEPIDVDPRDSLCASSATPSPMPRSLELALRHRSWCAENGSFASNERLEFLGDAVLGLVVTDHLFRSSARTERGRARPTSLRAGQRGRPGRVSHVGRPRRRPRRSARARSPRAGATRPRSWPTAWRRSSARLPRRVRPRPRPRSSCTSSMTASTEVLDRRARERPQVPPAGAGRSPLRRAARATSLTEDGPGAREAVPGRVELGGEPWGDGARAGPRRKPSRPQPAAPSRRCRALIDDTAAAAEHADDADDTANDHRGRASTLRGLADLAERSPGGDDA